MPSATPDTRDDRAKNWFNVQLRNRKFCGAEWNSHREIRCEQFTRVFSKKIDCDGFNYLIENGKARCLLMNENTSSTTTITDEKLHDADLHVLYAARKIALHKNCDQRSFAFEKFVNLEVIANEIILDSITTEFVETCLTKCHQSAECRAVEFGHRNKSCTLLRASPNTVYNLRKNFAYSDDMDIYENNCHEVSMSTSKCSFMRLTSAGFTDVYDKVLSNVDDVEECEIFCIEETKLSDPCRSYTYNTSSRFCYLSHQDGRSAGRSPLSNRNPSLIHGTLDDCIDFSMSTSKCSFMRLTSAGFTDVYDKVLSNVDDVEECEMFCIEETKLSDPCRSYTYNTSSRFCYLSHQDGRSAGRSPLSNRNPSLIHGTLDDCIDFALKCRNNELEIHGSSMRLFRMNNILYATKKSPQPRYTLRVLNSDGIETDVVRAGEQGWLSLIINEGAASHIFVSNLIARDINTKNNLVLIGDDGCVSHSSIIGISRVSSEEILYKINFGGFQKQAQLIYQALVETCTIDCSPKCNKKLWLNDVKQIEDAVNKNRRRRAIGPRQIELIQDIYKVHGSRITVLTPFSSARLIDSLKLQNENLLMSKGRQPFRDDDVHIEAIKTRPISSALEQCFSDDITCLFTVFLASIQLFLFASCIGILYCYIQQWRTFRNIYEQTPSQIQYEFNGPSKININRTQSNDELSNSH
ncbi:PAN domain protein [Dictyocaulus viviparus]|uniref:PAN domain protein n=1 Tax=Dictyocaulus viviparus TaxID=29172 RepID=A0A0D8YBC7_DICVI|nr:PAN domain protein [Dictyocaulus viviparus]